jgi:hypothetical protein
MTLSEPQDRSGQFGEENHTTCLLRIKPQFHNHPSRSPVTILIELPRTGLTEMRYTFKVLPKSVQY